VRKEALAAFAYINAFRAEPAKFGKRLGLELSNVKPRPPLKWSPTLAKAAEQKALDMARRNYFSHQTPEGRGMNIIMHRMGYRLPKWAIEKKGQNFFESIGAGRKSGRAMVEMLIIDKGVKNLGHRSHLLGISDFHARGRDIGIGFAVNPQSKFKTYMCVLIAFQK